MDVRRFQIDGCPQIGSGWQIGEMMDVRRLQCSQVDAARHSQMAAKCLWLLGDSQTGDDGCPLVVQIGVSNRWMSANRGWLGCK